MNDLNLLFIILFVIGRRDYCRSLKVYRISIYLSINSVIYFYKEEIYFFKNCSIIYLCCIIYIYIVFYSYNYLYENYCTIYKKNKKF
ncbi:hypothetical protein PFFVO_02680 [Plasmodium falciparum Vietnam Oak-Knoll (FVO)]|uniref:Uncharacterized protein n=1 Tax=Plasmodium falciparum Vietnam Oak-Knoll (FVO) TaxID=1036723 RepID=A0A024V9C0_PLAFA|nr:hypothetical protein PFFVO_02680 [Plasmodium falciparum Vietnam Oak-Knoll (FVO)]